MLISVCIPCYRSAMTLQAVVNEIRDEFSKRNEDYQIVLVNDCSPDNTFEVIRRLCGQDERIVGVDLSRNYGQVYAKLAALKFAAGDSVVFMDDDGQHPASGIFTLCDKLSEGYDVVYAHFSNKKASLFKKITSNIHNKIAEKMGSKPKGVHRSSFAAWSRTTADALKEYTSPFVSIGSYLMRVTTRYAEVPMEHRKRLAGRSGYTLKKLFRMWSNIFFSFSLIPLHLATYLGSILSCGGFIYALYLIYRKLSLPGYPLQSRAVIAALFMVGGIIMLLLGILGEYVGRIYMTVSGMPQYNIRQVVNNGNKSD